MEILRVLEEKISSLINVVQELKAKNEAFKVESGQLKDDVELLQADNTRLAEENAQLVMKLRALEDSVLKDSGCMEETKVVVDDLIRSIDALVGNEHQQ